MILLSQRLDLSRPNGWISATRSSIPFRPDVLCEKILRGETHDANRTPRDRIAHEQGGDPRRHRLSTPASLSTTRRRRKVKRNDARDFPRFPATIAPERK